MSRFYSEQELLVYIIASINLGVGFYPHGMPAKGSRTFDTSSLSR
jgi:hypothetical protein